jgi:hypothetical protein
MSLEISDSVGRWKKGARNLQEDVRIVQNMKMFRALLRSSFLLPWRLITDLFSLVTAWDTRGHITWIICRPNEEN